MDDVVAIKLRNDRNEWFAFITWGRLWHPDDDAKLLEVVRAYADECDIDGETQALTLCDSLREIRSAEYFYEALMSFAWKPIPFGDGYDDWRTSMQAALEEGREIYFAGQILEPE